MLLEQMIPSLRVLAWPGLSRIFEIGACEGEDTIKYARAFPGARMFLFEPLPANADRIAHVLAQDSSIKASLFRVALSDQAGTAIFHVSSAAKNVTSDPSAEKWAGNKSSSLLEPRDDKPAALVWLEFAETIEVQTETLDSFCERNAISQIDFIHMDVQGAELKVLAGAKRMLPRIRAIWMEVAFEATYEGQSLEPETTRWMADRGFRKIHQVSYGPEGDALFFNMRLPLSRPRFIALRLLQKVGLLRR
jgi:FkbM family methyltransferase